MKPLCVAVMLACGLQAQTFDVASIREARVVTQQEKAAHDQVELTASGVTMRNASLSFLIQWAWDLKFYQVSGPEWLKTERFEVQARAAEGTSPKDLRLMMRRLLQDRFKMAVHQEAKEQPVYQLVAGAFDFQLESMAIEMKRGEGSIVTAVADLGMQLKSAREPLPTLVVDRAEKMPSEN